jgi:hypothetical protein
MKFNLAPTPAVSYPPSYCPFVPEASTGGVHPRGVHGCLDVNCRACCQFYPYHPVSLGSTWRHDPYAAHVPRVPSPVDFVPASGGLPPVSPPHAHVPLAIPVCKMANGHVVDSASAQGVAADAVASNGQRPDIVPDVADPLPVTAVEEISADAKASKRRKRTNYPPISDPEQSFVAVMAATEASEIPSVKFTAPPANPGQRNRKRSIFDRNIFSMAYKCSRCGVLKRGHKCPPVPVDTATDNSDKAASSPAVDVQAPNDAQSSKESTN